MRLTKEQYDNIDPQRAQSLIATIAANIDNTRLSDKDFRQFIADSISLTYEKDTSYDRS